MSKGSALSRSIGYFREAYIDEARVAYVLVGEIMKARLSAAPAPHVTTVVAKPKQKRHRRTKAEMEAARAAAKAPKVTKAAVAASSGALSELYEEEAAS